MTSFLTTYGLLLRRVIVATRIGLLLPVGLGSSTEAACLLQIESGPQALSVWATSTERVQYHVELSMDLALWVEAGSGTLNSGERRLAFEYPVDTGTVFVRFRTERVTSGNLPAPSVGSDLVLGGLSFTGSSPSGVVAVSLERSDDSLAFARVTGGPVSWPMVDDEVEPNGSYEYRLVYTLSSEEVMATAPVAVVAPPPPPTPQGFTATPLSSASVRFGWDCAPLGPGMGYVLEISADGVDYESFVESEEPECLHVEDDFPFNGTVFFRLRFVNAVGESDPSASVRLEVEERVEAPTQVHASVDGYTSARVSWAYDEEEPLTRFEIWQSRDGGAWEFGENVPPNLGCAVRDGLEQNHTYQFRVRAYRLGDYSDLSSASADVFLPAPPAVPAPTGVSASNGETSARVNWVNQAGAVEWFEIWQSVDGGGFVFGENVPADRRSAVRDGLSVGHTYCFKVLAVKDGYKSRFSGNDCMNAPSN